LGEAILEKVIIQDVLEENIYLLAYDDAHPSAKFGDISRTGWTKDLLEKANYQDALSFPALIPHKRCLADHSYLAKKVR
jgi:hypothetical protein